MKILSLHCDYIRYKALKKALKNPEKITKKREKGDIKEPLVILTAIEKQDESNTKVVEQITKEIKKIAKQVKAKNILLYPYSHLSSSLSNPSFALKILKQVEKKLRKSKLKISRAPFGYYKEFELKCKGHPLAELSRQVNYESGEAQKLIDKSGEIKADSDNIDYKKLLKEISKTKLDTRKLKENDHRIIGQQMDLFSFSETAPGMVFWHHNGLIIYNKLIKLMRQELKKAGYQEIKTPEILDKKLWQISGHWDKYKENIFSTDYEKRSFAVKPMNCPGCMLVYKNKPKSYKDFPLKIAELGIVHRQELSGVLGGLFRVIQFTQDDAHVFCTEKQLEQEIINIIELTDKIYKIFNFKYNVELSTRPSKRIGSDKDWNRSEKALQKVLKKKKIKYKTNKGEGAFYGPKIDFHIKDSLDRTWQCGTIQVDFSMPERFDLNYKDEKNKLQRPIMIHRAIYGSLERFIGILIEHTKGHLPLWLAPIQVRIINFTDRNNKSCEKLKNQLYEQGFRVDIDLSSEPLGGKIKQAEMEKIPVIIVIGDKEEKSKSIAVRRNSKVKTIKTNSFIKQIKKEIENKK